MEQDWCAFRDLFLFKKRTIPAYSVESSGPHFFVIDRDRVVSAFSEYEDMGDWIGARVADVQGHFKNQEFIVFEKSKVDRWIDKTFDCDHFVEELEEFRENVEPLAVSSGRNRRLSQVAKKDLVQSLSSRHFLLQAMEGWWGHLLPTKYGMLLRIRGDNPRDLLLEVNRKKVLSFQKVDCSSLGTERSKDLEQVSSYLSGNHGIPVYAISVAESEWLHWSELPHPWKEIMTSIKEKRTEVFPKRLDLFGLFWTRANFGV